jgi:hypothetical protein
MEIVADGEAGLLVVADRTLALYERAARAPS